MSDRKDCTESDSAMMLNRWGKDQKSEERSIDRQSARQRVRVLGTGTTLFVTGAVLLAFAAHTLAETRSGPVRAGAWETPLSRSNVAAADGATESRPGGQASTIGMSPIGIDAAASAEFSETSTGPQPPPIRLEIPAAGIDTPVVAVTSSIVLIGEQPVRQWDVADYAAGHHAGSANPGEGGNIVLAGHSDWRGAVFGNLASAAIGDSVIVTSADQSIHRYVVTEIHYRKEAGVPLGERLATGQFIEPTEDERVTLVSCWPPLVDDHRLIVIAKPDPTPRDPS